MDTNSVLVLSTSSDGSGWANVIVTAIAVVAAVYAGWQANAILKIEMKRELDRDHSTRSEQSKSVSAWTRPSLLEVSNAPNYCQPGIEAVVTNNSLQPIFDVEVQWWISGEKEQVSLMDLVPPLAEITRSISIGLIDKYVGVEGYESSYMARVQAEEDCLAICEITRIFIKFRDSQNLWWTRDTNGILVECTPN